MSVENGSLKQFYVKWDSFEIPEQGCYSPSSNKGSTLYFYMRDVLRIPDSQFLKKLGSQKVSSAGKIIRKYPNIPEPFLSLPDSFYKSLEDSENEYDKKTIISMWESIGIKLLFRQDEIKTTLSNVLDECIDVILAPVIISNKDLTAFFVKVCVISNSRINVENPTFTVIGNSWPIKWEQAYKDAKWTADCKNGTDATEQFSMKYRLGFASIKPDLQSMLIALAQSITYGGHSVKCCRRISPVCNNINKNAARKNKLDYLPRYEWYEFDPSIEENICPIEPEIIRDFILNGDRKIRLSQCLINNSKTEQDSYYQVGLKA